MLIENKTCNKVGHHQSFAFLCCRPNDKIESFRNHVTDRGGLGIGPCPSIVNRQPLNLVCCGIVNFILIISLCYVAQTGRMTSSGAVERTALECLPVASPDSSCRYCSSPADWQRLASPSGGTSPTRSDASDRPVRRTQPKHYRLFWLTNRCSVQFVQPHKSQTPRRIT